MGESSGPLKQAFGQWNAPMHSWGDTERAIVNAKQIAKESALVGTLQQVAGGDHTEKLQFD